MSNIIASAESAPFALSALLEHLPDGRYRVLARDGAESWRTEPIDTLTEAWDYVDRWWALRGARRTA